MRGPAHGQCAPHRIEPRDDAWAPAAAVDDETFVAALRDAVCALQDAGIFYVLVGGIASAIVGRPRWTWDIDLLVAREDAQTALEALAHADFKTERTDPEWIFKAFRERVVVDLIFQSAGGIHLDEQMRCRAVDVTFKDVPVRIASAEDLMVMKALAHREEAPRYWYDALGIIAEHDLDWDYVVERSRHGPRRVLSLLLYAQSEDLLVPDSALRSILDRLSA